MLKRVTILLSISLLFFGINTATSQIDDTIILVDTTSDVIDGHTTSVATLRNNPGDDGAISFLEALLAIQNSGTGYTIRFNLPVGSVVTFDDTQVMRPGGTTIDGDVDANGTPDIVIDGPNGFISLMIVSSDNVLRNLVIAGLSIEGSDAHDNLIERSYLGTDVAGTASRNENIHAVQIVNAAANNRIENNVIAGNVDSSPVTTKVGVFLSSNATGNQIAGNQIGTGADGVALPNEVGIYVSNGATSNQIGGLRSTGCDFPCNVISGNEFSGITLDGATNNSVVGNFIGSDATGQTAIPNGASGILVRGGATGNVIGGYRPNPTCTELCNLISGNAQVGVLFYDAATQQNQVVGNYIGVSADGTTALGNQLGGVAIGGSASDNQIGDSRDGVGCGGLCNVISGNGQSGVLIYGTTNSQNRVYGNFIGTDPTGLLAIPNTQFGVDVTTTVVRAANDFMLLDDVSVSADAPSDEPQRTLTPRPPLPKARGGDGLPLPEGEGWGEGSPRDITTTQIGGATPATGNLISGNLLSGIRLYGNVSGTVVRNNLIGSDRSGNDASLGNGQHGIHLLYATNNMIGDENAGNEIAFNAQHGVLLDLAATQRNTIRYNSIHHNNGRGIRITNNAQQGIKPSSLDVSTTWARGGGVPPNSIIDIYVSDLARYGADGDGYSEGMRWVGSASADSLGLFNVPLSGVTEEDLITATVTDPDGNTSEFSFSPLVVGIEVTQTIQDIHNSVHLFRKKPTFARVYIDAVPAALSAQGQRIRTGLTGSRAGATLPNSPIPALNPGGQITLDSQPWRSFRNDAFLFQLKDDWLNGVVDLTVDNLALRCGEPRNLNDNAANDTTAHDCTTTVTFQKGATVDVRFVRIKWEEADSTPHLPSSADIDQIIRELKALYGIEGITYTIAPKTDLFLKSKVVGPPYTEAHFGKLADELGNLRKSDGCLAGCQRYYIGVIADEAIATAINSDLLGIADLGGDVMVAYHDNDHTMAHEFAHMANRDHTTCDGSEAHIDANFPYSGGRISPLTDATLPAQTPNVFYGFDSRTRQLVLPSTGDVISYCSPNWPSDYTYRNVNTHLIARFPPTTRHNHAPAQLNETILISGIVSPSRQSGQLDPIFTLAGTVGDLPQNGSGSYQIQFVDAAGQTLATHAFDPLTIQRPIPASSRHFTLALQRPTGTEHVRLLHNGEVVATRGASADPPTLTLQSPTGGETWSGATATVTWSASDANGDALTYRLLYSVDGGATWQMVASDLTTTTHEVDLNWLVGSQQARIRVLASDGFHTTMVESSADFTIATHPPTPFLYTPAADAQFSGQQMIALTGSGYDLEDGALTDVALRWSSDRDGLLGTGGNLLISADDLSAGAHIISLVVQDSDGESATLTVPIQISDTPIVQPDALSVAPSLLPLFVDLADTTPFTATILIRNQGSGTLAWTATSDQSWLQLARLSGSTPTDLVVTIDPAQLRMGQHDAVVAVSNQGDTVEMTVQLQVTDLARTFGRSPWPNSHDADDTPQIIITLDEAVDPATVRPDTIFVHASQTGRLPTYMGVDEENIFITPLGLIKPNEQIEVVLSDQVGFLAGGTLDSAETWHFRIAPTATSTGTFTDSQLELGGTNTLQRTEVALGDLDGDGDVDAIQTASPPNQLWRNNGNGSFADGGQPFGTTFVYAIALADVDGDGDLDAFVNGGVHLNDGAGNFTLGTALPTNGAVSVAMGDIDGDGDPDAIVGNYGANTVWINDGNGVFSDSGQRLIAEQYGDKVSVTSQLIFADLDDDGDLDAYAADALYDQSAGFAQEWTDSIWVNNGAGVFDERRTIGGYDRNAVAIADFNDDGHLDILSAGLFLRLFTNRGDGNFYFDSQYLPDHEQPPAAAARGQAVFVSDVDGDGDLDALVKDVGDLELWLFEDGSFTYSEAFSAPHVQKIGLGDLDGDGDVDAFLANWLNPAAVWWNGGSSAPLLIADGLRMGVGDRPIFLPLTVLILTLTTTLIVYRKSTSHAPCTLVTSDDGSCAPKDDRDSRGLPPDVRDCR